MTDVIAPANTPLEVLAAEDMELQSTMREDVLDLADAPRIRQSESDRLEDAATNGTQRGFSVVELTAGKLPEPAEQSAIRSAHRQGAATLRQPRGHTLHRTDPRPLRLAR
jgi:hypothetical protein